MKKSLLALAIAGVAFAVSAKLPAPDPAAKASADQTAAKAAWQAKVDGYQLCKVQDKVAAKYGNHSGKSAAAAKPAASAASGASGSTPTPAVASAPQACNDPGPFAYNAPAQKPLETSEAHSPAGNATSPPSVKSNSSEMTSGKTAAKK